MRDDDEPLDLSAVARDDAAIDALRTTAGGDAALGLLRELLLDVERNLPAAAPAPAPAPVSHGTTVVAFAAADERRLARGGSVVAAVTVGLLSLGGVAAASTLVPAGSALHGLGEAVRAATVAVAGAVTPPESPGRSAVAPASPPASPAALPSRAAAPRTPTPGATVSVLARSEAVARQVDQLLDAAAALLTAGRRTAADSRLDLAERKLAEVLPVHLDDLQERLTALRAEQAEPAAESAAGPAAEPAARPSPRPAPARNEPPKQEPDSAEAPRGSARSAPPRSEGKPVRSRLGQPSVKDASVKPRA